MIHSEGVDKGFESQIIEHFLQQQNPKKLSYREKSGSIKLHVVYLNMLSI